MVHCFKLLIPTTENDNQIWQLHYYYEFIEKDMHLL